ncbi:hypothetical protein Fleli_3272 [Bernardetia litoralis DSM 6794]|uniref:DUF5362 domain-containing protein n=1 Tax=Bernardetia litoralis (strain ATCC 23117 / DSM 6794 / NBRC 15988 / NCIMB 1366 / Fx l1 / Sio-4) TaxID=880071 RepID=I4ANR7_BERLS|nr:DUF5362 family protein [Bernardetia litoralis]AFM05602.1 hypothetical protein Fleli_3272 [Bernardetia litoralis DSM 6794]
MQKDDFLDKDSFYSEGGFQVTNRAKGFLATAAFWGKIVSIVGFVFTAFAVLAGVGIAFMGSSFSQLSSQMGAFGALGGIGIGLIYILLALVYFFPSLYLFNFSQKTQAAIRNSDNLELEEGFKNLKSIFKFMGVLTIIFIVLYALMFIFALIAGAMA